MELLGSDVSCVAVSLALLFSGDLGGIQQGHSRGGQSGRPAVHSRTLDRVFRGPHCFCALDALDRTGLDRERVPVFPVRNDLLCPPEPPGEAVGSGVFSAHRGAGVERAPPDPSLRPLDRPVPGVRTGAVPPVLLLAPGGRRAGRGGRTADVRPAGLCRLAAAGRKLSRFSALLSADGGEEIRCPVLNRICTWTV